MATVQSTRDGPVAVDDRWYSIEADQVTSRLGVTLSSGLSAAEARQRVERDGPNASRWKSRRLVCAASSASTRAICRSSWSGPPSCRW